MNKYGYKISKKNFDGLFWYQGSGKIILLLLIMYKLYQVYIIKLVIDIIYELD